jgi:hypothetical protein
MAFFSSLVGRERMPESRRLSLTRRFVLWLFEYPPFSPYVSVSVVIDAGPSRVYLESLKRLGSRVTVQHLLAAAIGRTYGEHPSANAAVIGGRIMRFDDVGVAMPIDLSDRDVGFETGMVFLERANTRALTDLAAGTRRTVEGERSGVRENRLFRTLIPLAERLPTFAFHRVLDGVDRIAQVPVVARALRKEVPVTVVLTNPGAAIPLPKGGLVRGGAISLPERVVPIGTLFGVSPMQDEVLVVDGVPTVRPVFPVMFVFDHRLFDGVLAGRILTRLVEILQNPAAVFGADGTRIG